MATRGAVEQSSHLAPQCIAFLALVGRKSAQCICLAQLGQVGLLLPLRQCLPGLDPIRRGARVDFFCPVCEIELQPLARVLRRMRSRSDSRSLAASSPCPAAASAAVRAALNRWPVCRSAVNCGVATSASE